MSGAVESVLCPDTVLTVHLLHFIQSSQQVWELMLICPHFTQEETEANLLRAVIVDLVMYAAQF